MRPSLYRAAAALGLAALGLAAPSVFAEASAPQSAPAPVIPFGFALDLNYEYRLAPPEAFLIETTPIKSGLDLMRNYFNRAPFARTEIRYGGEEGLSLALETSFRAQWSGDYAKADNLPGAGSGEPLAIENFFITRGVAYWRHGDNFVAFGRDKPGYDGILYGSLLPGRRLPYLDSLRARGRLGKFTVDWMAATIPAIKSWDAVLAGNPALDVDPNAGTGGTEYYGWETGAHPTTIIEGLTRFSWELGSATIGLSDHAMLARRDNRFYLTDFFPISSRHQTAIAQTNNSMILDLAWEPVPGLKIAAQAGFDDISAQIFGVSDTGSPTIDAYVFGAEYRRSGAGGSYDAALELGYTQYLWGNYEGYEIDPRDQNPFLRFQYRFLMDSGAALLPLTSPYGPGALWLSASGGYEFGQTGLRLGAEIFLLSKNQAANLIDTPVLNNTTTAAAPRFFYATIALPATWRLGPWELSAKPAILIREDQVRPEATLGARYALRTGTAR